MPRDLQFETRVSGEKDGHFELRGYDHLALIEEADFVSTLFLTITSRKPSAGEKELLNALLVAAIDHGINPASVFVPRVVAASGNNILAAMASVFLALGPLHGGAVADAMRLFQQVEADGKDDLEAKAISLVKEYRQAKKRLPGFGHPIYTQSDPRTKALFSLAQKHQLSLDYFNLAYTIETHLEYELSRKLVINVDGAMAAVLLTLGFQPETGNAIFALARAAGSIAHIQEEMEEGVGVRRLPDGAVKYNSQHQQD